MSLPLNQQQFTAVQEDCKAGFAPVCSMAADIFCTPTNLICPASISEACRIFLFSLFVGRYLDIYAKAKRSGDVLGR